jgi:dUTP diphosphatase
MLKVKKLRPDAILPTVANPGEDLGYDLYAVENVVIYPGKMAKIRNGIAVEFVPYDGETYGEKWGLLVRDRSSMASKGIIVSSGVIDAGYRGEMKVLLTNLTSEPIAIGKGDKIAQMIPTKVMTHHLIQEVAELSQAVRGEKGFGSSGK